MTQAPVLLFVYGTLMQKEANDGRLAEGKFLGEAITAEGYGLVDAGFFPAMVFGGGGKVHGELYRLNSKQLRRLDQFEGCPEDYSRQEVLLADGRRVQAYLGTPRLVDGKPRITSGNWRCYRQ